MHTLHPELSRAMAAMLEKLESHVKSGGYTGDPIRMFLAGGMAMHYHCGVRYTEDVDASFSKRLLVPAEALTVDYLREDGTPSALYFDANYNDTFALLHPDHRDHAGEWEGIGNEKRLVRLFVLAPVDLAVSKLSRFSPQDREDILALASNRLVNAEQLRRQASEALDYYVGDTSWIQHYLNDVCEAMAGLNR